MTSRLEEYVLRSRERVNAALNDLLPPLSVPPTTLHAAMRHSVFAGGKRIRPILLAAASEARGTGYGSEPYGAGIECIHTYSLIHDDLPALDNDDLRRGKPTCHKVFGEAVAVLAGDALLTLGLMAVARGDEKLGNDEKTAHRRNCITATVTRAIGSVDGMIGGQMADLEAENREPTPDDVDYIHRSKTAALIRACVEVGALLSEEHPSGEMSAEYHALSNYGLQVGLAFQIVDDILDVVSSSQVLGKTAGKDIRQGKATYPALYGIQGSRARVDNCLEEALDHLSVFGKRAWALRGLARWIATRAH